MGISGHRYPPRPLRDSPGGPGSPPGDLARQVREAADKAPAAVTWHGSTRIDVTLSLPIAREARSAAYAVAHAAPYGATVAGPHIGFWQGHAEIAFTVSALGDCVPVAPLVAAAHAHGCVAVQVERWNRLGYSAQEWRPA
jgi:hypothetical protein